MSAPTFRLRALALIAVLWIIVSAVPAHAQDIDLVQWWKRKDEAAVQAILDGKYEKALGKLDWIVRQMIERMGPGEPGEQAMGVVVMHRALARAGLGEKDDALWDWQIALNLYPALEDQDLSRFGDLGRILAKGLVRRPGSGPEAMSEIHPGSGAPAVGVVSPVSWKKQPPDYPLGARKFGIEGPVIVQMIITAQGDVIRPRVLRDLGTATITYSALESLRSWKFEPGRMNGKPVDVFYNVTMNFRMRR